MDLLFTLLRIAVFAYLGLATVLYFAQPHLIYYPGTPSRTLQSTPAQIGLAYREVALTASDGIRLHGWFVPAEPQRGVLLFFHGNAGNISHRLDSLRLFHELGLSVLLFDYRGYGRSEGEPSEAGTYLDAGAAWDYLTGELGFKPERIVLFGRSLGAAIAARTAALHPPGALIIDSGFASIPELAEIHYPYLPVRLLSRFEYATGEHLAKVEAPVLVIHSEGDDLVPFEQGRHLYEAAGEPKTFLAIEGGHNEAFLASYHRYQAAVDDFLGRWLSPPPARQTADGQ